MCTEADGLQECPIGYYCPAGTGLDKRPCPRGTFGNQTGLGNITGCLPCPARFYCPEEAMSEVTSNVF